MKRGTIIALLFILCLTARLDAYDDDEFDPTVFMFEMPSKNPTLEGYFTDVMNSVHAGMTDSTFCVFAADLLLLNDPFQFNLFSSFMLPLFGNYRYANVGVALAGFGEIINNSSTEDNNAYYASAGYFGWMAGGGLVIHGWFGTLAGYVGYSGIKESQYLSENLSVTEDHERSWEKLQWAVFSVIDAKRYPLLQTFVQLIEGYLVPGNFRMDRDGFQPSYKANVLFRNIGLGENIKMTLGFYTLKDWYNFDTKYELYVGKVDLLFPFYSGEYDPLLDFYITAEGGFRKYFDTRHNSQNYESGGYAKIALNMTLTVASAFADKGTASIFLESGSKPFFEKTIFGLLATISFNPETASRWGSLMAVGKENNLSGSRFDLASSIRIHP